MCHTTLGVVARYSKKADVRGHLGPEQFTNMKFSVLIPVDRGIDDTQNAADSDILLVLRMLPVLKMPPMLRMLPVPKNAAGTATTENPADT